MDLSKVKVGDIILVYFHDHSFYARGSKKDDKIMDIYVAGRLKSKAGKALVVETWWLTDKALDHNAEIAKILKSTIINTWRLEIK